MDKEEFLHRVMERTGLGRAEAKRATRAALAVLRDAIPPEEARDLGAQLPGELKDLMWAPKGQWTPPERLEMESLTNHVRSVLAPTHRDRADEVTRAIFSTLREAVSPGELEDIAGAFPRELQETVAR